MHRTTKKQRETGIVKFRGKATNTIRDITKHTKAGAHAQGPTSTDTTQRGSPPTNHTRAKPTQRQTLT